MTIRSIRNRKSERGNVFFTLFGAVAIVGVLGAGIMATMRGPLSTMVNVNRRTQAEADMNIASKMVLLEATQNDPSNNEGDCDLDGFVEPMPYLDAGASDAPVGGGFLPLSVGSNKVDPWGTNYGYCAWDPGLEIDADDCNGQNRLAGNGDGVGDANPNRYTIIAVISAGPDQEFDTTCTGGASPAISKAGGSDDMWSTFSYETAAAMGGGLWGIKQGFPEVAVIDKDIEAQGATFTGPVDLRAAASMFLPNETVATTCNAANIGIVRVNTTTDPDTLEVCDDAADNGTGPFTWVNVALGAAAISLWQQNALDTDEIYYDTDNVGIGITDPTEALDVVGNVKLTEDLLLATGSAITWGATGAHLSEAASVLELGYGASEINIAAAGLALTGNTTITGSGATDATNALVVSNSTPTASLIVQNDGDVGIGVASPDDKLEIAGNIDVSGHYKLDNINVLTDNAVNGVTLVGKGAGTGVTGAGTNNTIVGSGAGATLTTGKNNILIGSHDVTPINVPLATTENYLNIGNLIYGDLANKRIGIGTNTLDDALEVAGAIDATGNINSDASIIAATNITATAGNIVATAGNIEGGDILARGTVHADIYELEGLTNDFSDIPDCDDANDKVIWTPGTGWDCATDLQGGSGGAGQNLEEVLTIGNDAAGLDAVDLGGIAIGSGTLSTGGSQDLVLDVTGAAGADFFCDASGNNCFTASTIASGGTSKLNTITAADGNNTIGNAAWNQVWNWQLTGAETGFAFGETTASSGGAGDQYLLAARTLATSTATPFIVTNLGAANSFRVNDETGDADTTPFVIAADGKVGVGVAAPAAVLDVAANGTNTDFRISRIGNAAAYLSISSTGGAFGSSNFTANGTSIFSLQPTGVAMGTYAGGATAVPASSVIIGAEVGINDSTPDDGSGSGGQNLNLDVNGATGSAYFCDENGLNCFTAASVAGTGIWEKSGTVIRTRAPTVYATDDFVFGAAQLADVVGTDDDNRMFFDKSKGAFRAGGVTAAEWDDANVGSFSTAVGDDTTASGYASFAAGIGTVASGSYSSVFGGSSAASGSYSFAAGGGVTAGGSNSFAVGSAARALGNYSAAFGLGTTAGTYPQVSGANSMAIFMGDQDSVDVTASNLMALLGGRVVIDPDATSAANTNVSTGVQQLELDVQGDIGAINYCDEAGNNCFTPASVASNRALSAITAATAGNSINNADYAQVWNWNLTTADKDAFTFTENTASTATGHSSILKAATLATSTATPLLVTNLGAGNSFVVNDETGDADTSPFVVDATGSVGIGTATPAAKLHVMGTSPQIQIGDNTTAGGLRFFAGTGTNKTLTMAYDALDRFVLTPAVANQGFYIGPVAGASNFAYVATNINTAGPAHQGFRITVNGTSMFNLDATTGAVGVGNTAPASRFVVAAPAAEVVAAAAVITANACGTVKQISATANRTTDTTDTFTTPTASYAGCCMDVVNIDTVDTITLDANARFLTGPGTDLNLGPNQAVRVCSDGTSWYQAASVSSVASGGNIPLSGLTAAIADNSINSGNWNQVWNWQLAAGEVGLTIGENIASTGGSADQYILAAKTLAASTATPFMITNLGAAASFRVNDETGDADTSPFVVDATGSVGIGTTTPTTGSKLDVYGPIFVNGDANASDGDLYFGGGAWIYGIGTGWDGQNAVLRLNPVGTAGGTADFRDVRIYDGKTAPFVEFDGDTKRVSMGGDDSTPDAMLEVIKNSTSPLFMLSSAAANNGDLMIMDTNGQVGIGTTSPSEKLHISGSTETALRISSASNSAGSNSELEISRARGTIASPTVVQDGDAIFGIWPEAYDGNSYETMGLIQFEIDGTPGDGDMPGRIEFHTQPDGSAANPEGTTPEMVIKNDGSVGIGLADPASRFVVAAPSTEVIGAAATITANACGTVKRLSATANRTTDTTDTFTAPTASYAGCCMDVVNVDTVDTITLDNNAKFITGPGADLAVGPGKAVRVCSDGTSWYQASTVTSAAATILAIDDLSDAFTDYAVENNLIMGRAGAAALAAGAQRNTFIGQNAGATTANSTATTDSNTAVGYAALKDLTTGSQNTAVGRNALSNTTDGVWNVAVGNQALQENTVGNGNVAIGTTALYSNIAKQESTAIGHSAMFYADDTAVGSVTYNTAVGAYALQGSATAANNTGIGNTALGHSALMNNTSGIGNIGIGYAALTNNAGGHNNIGIGYQSMQANTSGQSNIAIGEGAMMTNATRYYNTAVGVRAMMYASSSAGGEWSGNTAFGAMALHGSTTAANNTGQYNTAIGYSALTAMTSGSQNTALGLQAGDSITTGSNNILLGFDIDTPANNTSNHLNIGGTIFGDLANDNVRIGGSGTVDVGPFVAVPPAAEAVAAAATITANACGTIKQINSTGNQTTNTTNTFTAPTGYAGCCMDIVNVDAADTITLDTNANFLTGPGTDLALGPAKAVRVCSDGAVWYQAASVTSVASGGNIPLSGLTAAIADNSINSGNWNQVWNWQLAAGEVGLTIGENTASTGGSADQYILAAKTLAASTATPFMITNLGAAASFRVNDATGDADTTPFVVDEAGEVGIGTATPGVQLQIHQPTGAFPKMRLTAADVTLPSYSGSASIGDVSATNTIGQIRNRMDGGGVQSGGLLVQGFTGSGVNNFYPLHLVGTHGGTAPTTAAVTIGGQKWSGTNNRAALTSTTPILDIENNYATAGSGGLVMRVMGDGKVGIGTAAPSELLDIVGTDATAHIQANGEGGATITTATSASANQNAEITARRSRGTLAAPTVVQDDDAILGLWTDGYDGDSWVTSSLIQTYIDGTPGDGDMPGRIEFQTQADGGGGNPEGTTPEMVIKNDGSVGIGLADPASRFVVAAPSTEVIGAAATITANACGTVKRLSATANRTTDTTDTFTAPTASYAGCCMDVVNVDTVDTITLDNNAKFITGPGADLAVGPGKAVRVCSDGTSWYQASTVTSAAATILAIDDLSDAFTDYAVENNLIMGRAGAAALAAGAQRNVFIGQNAGATTANSTATTDSNTAVGYTSLASLTSGDQNTAIGRNSLQLAADASWNTAVGNQALQQTTSGDGNTAIGSVALLSNVAKQESTAIGYGAMFYADDTAVSSVTYNTAVGAYALQGSVTAADNTGTANTAIGHSALLGNTSGTNNTALGRNALAGNTQGYSNTAIGSATLVNNDLGQSNVAIGYGVLATNTGSHASTGVGAGALGIATGGRNTALGAAAGDSITTGTDNIVIGFDVDTPANNSTYHLNIGDTIFGDLANDNVRIGGSGVVGAGPFTVAPPSTEVVAAAAVITANACGSIKQLSATANRTTDTTDTFTTPTAAYAGCCMDVVNVDTVDTITLDQNARFLTGPGTDLALGPNQAVRVCSDGTSWYQAASVSSIASGGNIPLSGLTAAIAANSINNADYAQTWNWQVTTNDKDAFTFTENTASTATGHSSILKAATIAASTATPLRVTNLGAGDSFVVNDETGDADTTPFIVKADGKVGIGTTTPAAWLTVRNTGGAGGSVDIMNFSAEGEPFMTLRSADNSVMSQYLNPLITTFKSRGTLAAPAIVQSGDTIFEMYMQGYDGASDRHLAYISALVDGTPGVADMPGRLEFHTQPDGGGASPEGTTPEMVIKNSGNIGMSIAAPSSKLHVSNADAIDSFRVDDVASDTTPFVIDQTGEVGIGIATPDDLLDLGADAEAGLAIAVATSGDPNWNPYIMTKRSRGTMAVPTAVQSGDMLLDFDIRGYDGAAHQPAAMIEAVVDGTPGAGDMPTRLEFQVQADGAASWMGDGLSTPEMVIKNNGAVGIGMASPASRFVVASPTAEVVGAAAVITANSCGTVKRISATANRTTDTTDTFTTPTASYAGCCMDVINIDTVDTITLDQNARFFTGSGGDLSLGPGFGVRVCSDGTSWYQAGGVSNATAGSSVLSAITAAAGANSINNGDHAQTWNWALTTADKDAFTFTENTASTATGHSSILKAATLATSTATPLRVTNLGAGDSFVVNDETGDADTSPFVVAADGKVAIGKATPNAGAKLDVNGPLFVDGLGSGNADGLFFGGGGWPYNIGVGWSGYSQLYINAVGTGGGTADFRDLGIMNGKSNMIAFYQGSTKRFSVGGDDTTPDAMLEVIKDAASPLMMLSSAAANNGDLMIVDTNGKVGIGTATPTGKLDIRGDVETQIQITAATNSATQNAEFEFYRARGTVASPTVVSSGDAILGMWSSAYDGNSYEVTGLINFEVDGTPGDGDMPGRIEFHTTPDGTAANPESGTPELVIKNSGFVGIGTASPTDLLHVAKDQNGSTAIRVSNATAGASAEAQYEVVTDVGNLYMGMNSSTYSTNPGDTYLINTANTDMRFATNNTYRMIIEAGGDVGIGNTSPASLFVVGSPTAEVVGAAATITANSCGTVKQISATANRTTNTTDTFTTPTASYNGCCMDVVNIDTVDTITLDQNGNFFTGPGTDLALAPGQGVRVCSDGTDWYQAGGVSSATAGGSVLSAITAAVGANSINNGDHAQVWNWQLTTADKDAFTFTENTASTATGHSSILKAATLATSTATPLRVTNLGAGDSFVVNDETGDADATPFVVKADGKVGIGMTAPATALDVTGSITVTSGQLYVPSGTFTDLAITIGSDADSGFYSPSDGVTYLVSNGTALYQFQADKFRINSATAQIEPGFGTAANPTYSFDGDDDIGWYRAAADEIGISTAGTEKIRVDASGDVGIGLTSPASRFVVASPAAEVVGAAAVITANSCGTVKQISATANRTTDTTDTFTTPTASYNGCCMDVVNIDTVDTITLDQNAKFFTGPGTDLALGPGQGVRVCSDGTSWYQAGGVSSATAGSGSSIDGLTDAYADYTTLNNIIMGRASAAALAAGAQYNLFIGENAGATTANSTAATDLNVAVGHYALPALTSGSYNTAVGALTLQANTVGSDNVAIGTKALNTNVAKHQNTAIGHSAMEFADSAAGSTITYNTAVGAFALQGSATAANNTGTNNTALGHSALIANTSGSNNVALGSLTGSTITTGGSNILIGYDIEPPAATTSSHLNIGGTIFGDISTDNVRIGGSGAVGAGPLIANPPAAEGIAAAATITANSCGTVKQINATGNQTTNTTDTFTAPTASYSGCCMDVVNVDTVDTITLDSNAKFFTGAGTDLALGPGKGVRVCSDGTSWYQAGGVSSLSTASVALSGIIAAASDATINSAANNITWNWQLAGAEIGHTFGENTASTGGSSNQYILAAKTLASSTATPFMITNLGAAPTLRINDETGDADTTPFIIDASGNVGIGITAPTANLHVASDAETFLIVDSAATNQWLNPTILGRRSRGTLASPTIVADDDELFAIGSYAYDGNSYEVGGYIGFYTDGTPGNNDMPTRISLFTAPDGSATLLPRMTVNNAGNVGIGITDPTAPLHIKKATDDWQLATLLVEGDGEPTLALQTSSAFDYFNPIIGTSRSRGSRAAKTTVVNGDTLFEISVSGYDGSNDRVAAYISAVVDATVSGGGAADMPTRLEFNVQADGAGGGLEGTTPDLVIKNNGRVGIGVAAPETELHVVNPSSTTTLTIGNPNVIGNNASDGYIKLYGENAGAVSSGTISMTSTNMFLTAPNSIYSAAKHSVIRGSTAGNSALDTLILMGNDTDSAASNGVGANIVFTLETSVDEQYRDAAKIEGVFDDVTDNSKDGSLRFYTMGPNAVSGTTTTTERMRIDSSGNVGIGTSTINVALDVNGDIEYTGTIADVSDIRLKTNIHPLGERGSMLQKLGLIDTYSFTMKDDKEGRVEFGVMAQEIEKIFPELVRTADDEMGTKSVNYVGLIAPMIEAGKELEAQNKAMKAEIDTLKAQQDEMKQAMNDITEDMKGLKVHTGYGIGKAEMSLLMILAALGTLGAAGLARRRFGKPRQ